MNRRKTFTWNWIQDNDVLSTIRYLTVNSSGLYRTGSTPIETYQDFDDVIRRIKNLKSLTWNAGPIKISLLETLHKYHPNAVLKLFSFDRFDGSLDHLDNAEKALSTYPKLTDFRSSRGDQYGLATFKSIVASSGSLRYAGIVLPNGIRQLDFPQTEDEILESTRRRRCSSLRSLTLDGASLKLSKDSLDELDKYIDIMQLESLKFSRGLPDVSYFENAASMLPKLNHISLNFGAISGTSPRRSDTQPPVLKAARDYLLNCPSLQTISLWAWKRVIDLQELVDHHGKTLTSLHLHEKEESIVVRESWELSQRPNWHPADLKLLRQNCPLLRDLTLDMNRRWEDFALQSEMEILQLLDELASFKPQLRKLQIYFGTDGLPIFLYPQPAVDTDYDDEASEEGENHSNDSDDNRSNGDIVEEQTVGPGRDNNTLRARERLQPLFVMADAEIVLQDYVRSIWKHVYGGAMTGERLLDVKFGEWESKHYDNLIQQDDPRRYFEARPHERDDMIGECEIKMRKK